MRPEVGMDSRPRAAARQDVLVSPEPCRPGRLARTLARYVRCLAAHHCRSCPPACPRTLAAAACPSPAPSQVAHAAASRIVLGGPCVSQAHRLRGAMNRCDQASVAPVPRNHQTTPRGCSSPRLSRQRSRESSISEGGHLESAPACPHRESDAARLPPIARARRAYAPEATAPAEWTSAGRPQRAHERRVPRRSQPGNCETETVSRNAARLGRSVHLCLCKTPGHTGWRRCCSSSRASARRRR